MTTPESHHHAPVRLDVANHGNDLHIRTISIPNLSRSDEYAWRDLAERSVEPNPFYEADFLVPASRHLRKGKKAVLVVAEGAGCFHACLPVSAVGLGMAISPPVITSWQHLYGYLGIPLVAPERAVEALSCILVTLRGRGLWPRVVAFELFGDDGPVAFYLRRAAADLGLVVHAHASGERAAFRCRGEKEGRRPASVRGEWRAKARQWRRLCNELGDPAVVDRAENTDGPPKFLTIEAAGWKGKAGTALACRPGDAAFYEEVTARFAASGRLRLYSLEVAGGTMAMQTSLRADSALFHWKTAYDERFASYGPGAQLEFRIFDLAQQEGTRWIDSCSDVGNKHELRLFPDRRRIATLIISRNGRMDSLLLTLAVLNVKMNAKLRGLSPRTLRHGLARIYSSVRKVFRR